MIADCGRPNEENVLTLREFARAHGYLKAIRVFVEYATLVGNFVIEVRFRHLPCRRCLLEGGRKYYFDRSFEIKFGPMFSDIPILRDTFLR